MTKHPWLVFASVAIATQGVTRSVAAEVLYSKAVDARVAYDAAARDLETAKQERDTAQGKVDAVCKEFLRIPKVSAGFKPPAGWEFMGSEPAIQQVGDILRGWTSPADATVTDPVIVLEKANLSGVADELKVLDGTDKDQAAQAIVKERALEIRAAMLAVCPLSDTFTRTWAVKCRDKIASLVQCDSSAVKAPYATFLEKSAAVAAKSKAVDDRRKELDSAMAEASAAGAENNRTLESRLARVRKARCMTAYCFGGPDGRRYGIEPILDLPIGMFWAVGQGALAGYINSNNIKIQFTAGLRYWFAGDTMSVGVLLAQPDLTSATQGTVEFRERSIPASQIRRPYPTFVVGLWGDILQLSVSYDTLRNAKAGDTANYIPEFAPNAVLARTLTFGLAISPMTAARNGIGASVVDSDKKGASQ